MNERKLTNGKFQRPDDDMFGKGDDVEGHRRANAGAEATEGDDVEGHRSRGMADTETSEGDDVEGHRHI